MKSIIVLVTLGFNFISKMGVRLSHSGLRAEIICKDTSDDA